MPTDEFRPGAVTVDPDTLQQFQVEAERFGLRRRRLYGLAIEFAVTNQTAFQTFITEADESGQAGMREGTSKQLATPMSSHHSTPDDRVDLLDTSTLSGDVVTETYTLDQERTLNEAVLDAIATATDTDLHDTPYTVYDYIEPDALAALFRHDTQANTVVGFDVADVRVTLQGGDGINITVAETKSTHEQTTP